jgi:mutual gliding-motility protein MglA
MASINYGAREISVKIVYYGPGLSGKTTNLQVIHKKIPQQHKSDMVSLATETDRTLFFDFLPLDLGTIKGFSTKFQLYTVPGQVYYNATRKLVLRGVDGVVFVADSGADKIQENLESFQNLEDNLAEYHYKREEIPIIIQYNKRDLPNAMTIEELQRHINKYNLPFTESIANKGLGVFDALKLMGKIVIDNLNKKYSRLSRGPSGATRPPAQQQTPAPFGGQLPTPQPQQQQFQGYNQQRSEYPNTPASAPFQPKQSSFIPAPPVYQQQTIPMPSATARFQQAYPAPSEHYVTPAAHLQQQTYAPIPEPPTPALAPKQPQQQYGFVNFEPLPVEPSAQNQEAGMTDTPAQFPNSSVGQQSFAQPESQQHNVVFPQKQHPARTQIDERDYSVYQVDSAQASFPKSVPGQRSSSIEDTDISIRKKLNAPPPKQQKGFLSKFFNRDDS